LIKRKHQRHKKACQGWLPVQRYQTLPVLTMPRRKGSPRVLNAWQDASSSENDADDAADDDADDDDNDDDDDDDDDECFGVVEEYGDFSSSEDEIAIRFPFDHHSSDSSSGESEWQAFPTARLTRSAKSKPRSSKKKISSTRRASIPQQQNNSRSTSVSSAPVLRRLPPPWSVPFGNLLVEILKLHDVREFFCIHDLISLSMTSKFIRDQLKEVLYSKCHDDGRDYLVPFPAFPGLLSTPADLKVKAGLFPHQLASLLAMHRAENKNNTGDVDDCRPTSNEFKFGALRGGILGDAPGLGKTITMLALIASTAGVRPVLPPDFWNDKSLQKGWELCRRNVVCCKSILAALKPLRSWVNRNVSPRSPEGRLFMNLSNFVEPPYDDDRFPTIRDFERFVLRGLRSFVPMDILELFRNTMLELKASLDYRRQRRLSETEAGRRLVLERSLIPTSGTLIIVPDALFEHWYEQIARHLDLRVFAVTTENDSESDQVVEGVVYLDGIGDLADVTEGRTTLQRASIKPLVLPPCELARYLIVITTFSRCGAEFEMEVKYNEGSMHESLSAAKSGSRRKPCPLLQMRWLRLVVDEGHELGTNEVGTMVTRFIYKIAAERRWVLSGTPTTGNEDDDKFTARALDQLQRLLFFLRHPKYGVGMARTTDHENTGGDKNNPQLAKSLWDRDIKMPFLAQRGREKLSSLLREVLVMHQKHHVELPKPSFEQAVVNIPIPEIVQEKLREKAKDGEGVNALDALDEYLQSQHFQSLVDQAQAKYIVQAVRNARRERSQPEGNSLGAYCVKEAVVKDRRPIKAVVYSSNTNILLSVTEFLIRRMGNESVAEMMETLKMGENASELSRFRHGERECRICSVCKRENDIGASSCANVLIEVVSETSPRTRFLIEPERLFRHLDIPPGRHRPLSVRMQREPTSHYRKHSKFWRVNDTVEVDIRSDRKGWAGRESEERWEEVGSRKCISRAKKDLFVGPDWYFGPLPISKGDQGHLVDAKLKKWQTCGKFHNAGWYSGPKLFEAPSEKVQQDVPILCLDAALSHGLDLSFVTHIFLLEALDDAALLEQVTSRAHRLGAIGSVQIITVNTLYNLSQETQKAIDEVGGDNPHEASKVKQKKDKILCTINCDNCYRQFKSKAAAEKHEQTQCPRNPAVERDPFRLMTVFQEIRPPPCLVVNDVSRDCSHEPRNHDDFSNIIEDVMGDDQRRSRFNTKSKRPAPALASGDPSGPRDARQVFESIAKKLAMHREAQHQMNILKARSANRDMSIVNAKGSQNNGRMQRSLTDESAHLAPGRTAVREGTTPPLAASTDSDEPSTQPGMLSKRKGKDKIWGALKKRRSSGDCKKRCIDDSNQLSYKFPLKDVPIESSTKIMQTPSNSVDQATVPPGITPAAQSKSNALNIDKTSGWNTISPPKEFQNVRVSQGVANTPIANAFPGNVERATSGAADHFTPDARNRNNNTGFDGCSSSRALAVLSTSPSTTMGFDYPSMPTTGSEDLLPQVVSPSSSSRERVNSTTQKQEHNPEQPIKLLKDLYEMRRKAYDTLRQLDEIMEDDKRKKYERERAQMEQQAEEESLAYIQCQILQIQRDTARGG
jgi:hypothetical protein